MSEPITLNAVEVEGIKGAIEELMTVVLRQGPMTAESIHAYAVGAVALVLLTPTATV